MDLGADAFVELTGCKTITYRTRVHIVSRDCSMIQRHFGTARPSTTSSLVDNWPISGSQGSHLPIVVVKVLAASEHFCNFPRLPRLQYYKLPPLPSCHAVNFFTATMRRGFRSRS